MHAKARRALNTGVVQMKNPAERAWWRVGRV
jgi:hypothetical protein